MATTESLPLCGNPSKLCPLLAARGTEPDRLCHDHTAWCPICGDALLATVDWEIRSQRSFRTGDWR